MNDSPEQTDEFGSVWLDTALDFIFFIEVTMIAYGFLVIDDMKCDWILQVTITPFNSANAVCLKSIFMIFKIIWSMPLRFFSVCEMFEGRERTMRIGSMSLVNPYSSAKRSCAKPKDLSRWLVILESTSPPLVNF